MLILIITLALAVSAYYFSSISIVDLKVNNLNDTRLALKKAKQLLLNYAVMHASQNGAGNGLGGGDPGEYGYFPCPYITQGNVVNEGKQNGNCGAANINSMGYLPWTSLQSEILRDGHGNCLWYAVSGAYKNATNSGLINEDTNGMFQIVDSGNNVIAGVTPENRIVAVVFAPGAALGAQSRVADVNFSCGSDGTNAAAYLEGNGNTDNATLLTDADNLDTFIQASLTSDNDSPPYNDHFITITRSEIWAAIMATTTARSEFNNKMTNLTAALAECLRRYALKNTKNRLPWPAPMSLTDYRVNNNYADVTGYAGRLPFIVADSNTAIGVGTNNELFVEAGCNVAGGFPVDLIYTPPAPPPPSESRTLWNNWKDHFFYVLSKDYEPATSTASACAGNCITVNNIKMAGVVIFSGSRQANSSQLRNGGIATDEADTKQNIRNYIEGVNNQTAFIDATGTGDYFSGGNDIMYCIQPDLNVVSC
ncbi:hypothetical protein MNBD_GAMMA06-1145 [hydrothermal vent metagenome]|uniref:Uncharacterized protein n=1 Tax=hydrothermal vent metagenome TaxID=652676 RepID=A0A3B0X753_9ZZZZ